MDALVPNRLDWFREARFGMFVHWGLYALHGRGEWAISREAWPMEDYVGLAERFTADHYDPAEWARVAKDAGMRYVVLTTKHHEGFCLWDSPTCSFNAVNSGAKRDLLRPFVEAVRAAGLKVGFYYSLGDWFNQDWFRGWQGDAAARERFMAYTHTLVRELMTGYGRIDVLWYDLPQCYTPAEWRAVELNAMVRQLQPGILINNRAYTTEDFATPEQHVAAAPRGRPWEACMTLNHNWGYCPSDHDYKSPKQVALNLANVASGDGNLLLNVGPDPTGRIPERSRAILASVGAWLRTHEVAIRGTERNPLMWYHFGPTTVRGHTLFCFLDKYHGETVHIGGLARRVQSAHVLSSGQRLRVTQQDRRTAISGLPATEPDPVLTVLQLELDGPPDHDISRFIGGADIFPVLPR